VFFSCRTRSGTQSSTRFGVLGWGLRFRRHNVAHGYSKNRCVVNARFGVSYHSDPRRPYPFRFLALQSLPLPPVWQCHPLPIGPAAEIQYGGAGGGRAAVGEADEVLMVDIPRFNDSRSTVPNIYVSRQELWMNVYYLCIAKLLFCHAFWQIRISPSMVSPSVMQPALPTFLATILLRAAIATCAASGWTTTLRSCSRNQPSQTHSKLQRTLRYGRHLSPRRSVLYFFFAVTRVWNVSPSKGLEASLTVDVCIFYPIPILNRNSKSGV
jgi:hypothetical protein